jgi:hypothetical protein
MLTGIFASVGALVVLALFAYWVRAVIDSFPHLFRRHKK